jgi:hypothetical protein
MKVTQRIHPVVFALIILIVVALIIAGPLVGIWALNTLFPQLAIPYDVWTWLAMFVVLATLSPRVRVDKKD